MKTKNEKKKYCKLGLKNKIKIIKVSRKKIKKSYK
jgi:hypothetical protein